MSDQSAIEWTDATWNPVRARNRATGKVGHYCEHVTEACRFCYAEAMNRWRGTGVDYQRQNRDQVELFLDEKTLLAPLRWTKPRMIFPCSMTDLFGDFMQDEWIDRMVAVMALTPQHTYQVLTKRPGRQRDYMSASDVRSRIFRAANDDITSTVSATYWHVDHWPVEPERGLLPPWPLPNVWAGTSIHDQPSADEFVPELLAMSAARRFLSCEPLLAGIELPWLRIAWQCSGCRTYFVNAYRKTCPNCGRECYWTGSHAFNPRHGQVGSGIDWVIAGGESGPNARPMHPDWARSLRDQCAAAGVPFFFKQWGEWFPTRPGERVPSTGCASHEWNGGVCAWRLGKKHAGRLLDGREHSEMPSVSAGFRDRAARDAGARR